MADFFTFCKYCNDRIDNNTDYNIACTILNHINSLDQLSSELIAQESMTSKTTVSRFIKKAGFESYSQFKNSVSKSLASVHAVRDTLVRQKYFHSLPKDMMADVSSQAIENLKQTILSLDENLLNEIAYHLRKAHHVLILGDTHEINDFYPLQIDLLGMGISCRLANVFKLEKLHYMDFEEGDVILFLNLSVSWIPDSLSITFQSLLKKGILIYSFVQEKGVFKEISTNEYIYGQPESENTGYISLPLINTILSNYIYLL